MERSPDWKLRPRHHIFCPLYLLAKHAWIMFPFFMQYIQVVSFVGCLYCIFTASEKSSICDVFTVTHIGLLTINACAAFNHRYPWKTLTHSLNKNRKMKTGDCLNYQIIQEQRQMKDRWHVIFILLCQWANSLLGLMPPEENEDLNAQPTQNVIKLFDF